MAYRGPAATHTHGSVGTSKINRGITRSKTGCKTCRRRKKKCDEGKPGCSNCRQINVKCEGYARQDIWEAPGRIAHGRAHGSTLSTASSPTSSQSAVVVAAEPSSDGLHRSQLVHSSNLTPQSQNQEYYQQLPLDDGLDFVYVQYQCGQSPALDEYQQSQQWISALQSGSSSNEQFLPLEPGMPLELPSLISGVDSGIHRRLFGHFTQHMSKVLTMAPGESNLFNEVVIPLALADGTVMETLLCLAGAHLQNLHSTKDEELSLESLSLHDRAVRSQESRIQTLKSSPNTAKASSSKKSLELILATSLILCLYEICKGTGQDTWRKHLGESREVITLASWPDSESPSPDESPSSRVLATGIDPFLIEFFVYHDSLAKVTVPSTPTLHPANFGDLSDITPSMVGVGDGLIDFVTRVSKLRDEAINASRHPSGNVVTEGFKIFSDLESWRPNPKLTPKRRLINDFYKLALFIWLFSIVNPDAKEVEKVQAVVRRLSQDMFKIDSGDGEMACLLFPLFIAGSAAIRAEDRERIESHFERLSKWSSLRNIDLTRNIVQKMWRDHDEGVAGSWDWVRTLDTNGMSFLVT